MKRITIWAFSVVLAIHASAAETQKQSEPKDNRSNGQRISDAIFGTEPIAANDPDVLALKKARADYFAAKSTDEKRIALEAWKLMQQIYQRRVELLEQRKRDRTTQQAEWRRQAERDEELMAIRAELERLRIRQRR